MGVLGIYLLFVGIVLVINGVNRFYKLDAKSMAIMNAFTGAIIVLCCFINFAKGGDTLAYQNIASGFLFGFTYIFIASNNLLKLDWRPFGWFSLFVTVYAVFMAFLAIQSRDFKFVFLWAAWALLWLNGFLDIVLGMKSMSKIFPYLSIMVGVFAAFIPSVMMLTDKW